jgi:hypothetical protein
MNNPLSLIDPSGYSWVSKKWKSVKKAARKIDWKEAGRFALRTAACGPYCAAAYSKPGQKYIRSHKWAQQTMSIVAGAADAMGCAGACSAANAAMLTDINGGSFKDIAKSAAMAYATYVAFSSVNAQYGDAWSTGRVLDNALVGGAVAKANGGKFADGFNLSGGIALMGYIYSNTLKAYSESFNSFEGGNDPRWEPGTVATTKLKGESLRSSLQLNIGVGNEAAIGGTVIKPSSLGVFSGAEGSILSRTTNMVAGFNSFSVIHDVGGGFLERADLWNLGTNFGSMPPALVVNYGALLAQQPHTVSSYQHDIRKQRN